MISNLKVLEGKLPDAMADCLKHFPGIDRSIDGFGGLEAAQDCLNPYQHDYRWLTSVYQSVKPSTDNIGKLLWHTLGTKTSELIHEGIHVKGIVDDMKEYVLDADTIDHIAENPDPKKIKDLEKALLKRLGKHAGNPAFKELSERLESLRDKAEKELCKIARGTVEAEKNAIDQVEQKTAKAALSELFLSLKTNQTPAVVERIVNDIDSIVKIVRFDGWQNSVSGEREVQKSLRKSLLKYKLHKDQDLFEKAYAYIREYY